MTIAEIIASLLSVAAFVASIIAIRRTTRENTVANELRAEHARLHHAQVEMELRNQITASRTRVEDFVMTHGDFLEFDESTLSGLDEKRRIRLVAAGNSAIEGYLNALDAGCQAFIDDKLDRDRFKKAYQRDMRQAVEDKAHRELLGPGRYNALKRVHDEWENTERT